MPVNIKKDVAEKILLEAFREKCSKNDTISQKISVVLNGTHLTYRYILINGILAKAADEMANPLALQAGSSLEGAYDARSLCHQVLVPFERDFLGSALGGSNEPFLNKPARNTELSMNNPVRGGNDRMILQLCIDVLSNIKSSKEAKEYLACSLILLNNKIEKVAKSKEVGIKYNPTIVEIYEYIVTLIENSIEGETCVLTVAVLENLFYKTHKDNFIIQPHKTNQSGASSREIGDIDIFKNGKYLYSIEIKDKDFNEYDFKHAIDKVKNSGGAKAQFIYGPNAKFDSNKIGLAMKAYEKEGVFVVLNNIYQYSRGILIKLEIEDKSDFLRTLHKVADEIKIKDETRIWIGKVTEKLKWN